MKRPLALPLLALASLVQVWGCGSSHPAETEASSRVPASISVTGSAIALDPTREQAAQFLQNLAANPLGLVPAP